MEAEGVSETNLKEYRRATSLRGRQDILGGWIVLSITERLRTGRTLNFIRFHKYTPYQAFTRCCKGLRSDSAVAVRELLMWVKGRQKQVET